MKIKVQLEEDEYVENWTALRDAFVEAAEKVGLEISTIIHTDEELV